MKIRNHCLTGLLVCALFSAAVPALGAATASTVAADVTETSESTNRQEPARRTAESANVVSAEGALRLDLADGHQETALLKHTDVRFSIAGMLIRTRVSQQFSNRSRQWAEGVYSFPLPENAAVDRLRMKVGDRIIEGQIQERRQARQRYTAARQSGRRASLIEQQRPNIFTTSVANIGPGETIEVEIEYQQQARYDSGSFSLRFPLVVAPRYIPGRPLPAATDVRATDNVAPPDPVQLTTELSAGPLGWSLATDQVPDAHLITPPVAAPGEMIENRVSISAELNSGFALQEIRSSYHPISIQQQTASRAEIRLRQGPVPADRDFELVWIPRPGAAPRAALLSHQPDVRPPANAVTASAGVPSQDRPSLRNSPGYGLLMLVPPTLPASGSTLPKSQTLVLDISGSMHGDSIEQAKLSLSRAIDRLGPADLFNLIVFNDRTDSLFPEPQLASRRNRNHAHIWLSRLEASGGTEMAAAISRSLSQPQRAGYVEQVLFVTDGVVGNEEALFRLISGQRNNQRLFTVGIGSAPNSHFMRKAAQLGRGTSTMIGSTAEVQQKMDRLLNKLSAPRLTDIRIEGADLLAYPEQLPDLYQGEPLLLSFRADQLPERLTISGSTGEQRWQQQLTLKTGADNPAVAVLWARKRIAALMDRHRLGNEQQRQQLRKQVVDTALAHHLVSRFTSLVAVEVTPVRPEESTLQTRAVKTQLPKGWSHQKIFGMARTATPAQQQMLIGTLLLAAALFLLWLQGRRADQSLRTEGAL